MSAALLHRRLTAGMAFAALLAYAVGAGWTLDVVASALGLAVAMVRLPPPSWGPSIERATRIVIVALCLWMLYVAFVVVGDFMPAVMAMLLVLLGGEALRPLEAKNDGRLYLLAFALMIAATAYYPGLAFAAAFVGFVVLSTLAMMVGSLRRQAERFDAPGVRVPRRTLAGAAALSAVTLLVSVAFFVIFPRLPRQWNVQGRGGAGDVMAGFGDGVSLGEHGGRLTSNPEVAFRVEFPDGTPVHAEATYWRGRSFDRFDGVRWTRTRGLPGQVYGSDYARRWGGPTRSARIFGGPAGADVLFGQHPVITVQPRSAIRVRQDATGDLRYFGSDEPVYTVTSGRELPPERLLANSPEDDSPLVSAYLQLPRLAPAVRALADSLTRGQPSRVGKVRAVAAYLRTFEYSLELPETRRDATIEGFLFRRRAGHCEYFSSAMVVMLRSVGIPARNVTGFLGGEWNEFGAYLAVTGNDAHSWVEVWFPALGWVPFDPTPPSRNTLVDQRTGTGWSWPARFWFDGLEHRWYKWVLDYNLERQLAVFRGLGDLFSRGSGDSAPWSRGRRPGAPGVPPLVALAVGLLVAGAGVMWIRRGRMGPRSAETRSYLALRRAYERARLGGAAGPMDFAERLERERAPGAAAAMELVRLYVRARFGGEDIGLEGRECMDRALREARAALRAARRRPQPNDDPPPGDSTNPPTESEDELRRRRGWEPAGV
ncbi:transglutaminase TgpA family protein [Longimicrobium sp.]|jgi:transglutaminase-like putative cysteine protease|uniref:transglutaminase TgpA family protein n=1 Tax=Longimicrobium sp. TaxID=2029185 RepID=UPI002F932131